MDNCACRRDERRESRDFCCPDDRRVIKHRHVVNHKHDEIHEYDVVHQHEHHIYDVVRVHEEHTHHDHRQHKPDYCPDDNCDCIGDGEFDGGNGGWNGGGSGEIEIVRGRGSKRCKCD
jgi:hypothetical protein